MISAERPVDLHTHTTASDGTMSPSELVTHASNEGLSAISITDHDTTSGLAEGMETAKDLGIEFLAGVEISAHVDEGTLHILGYLFDLGETPLKHALQWMREQRIERNRLLIEKLQALGLDVELSEVAAISGEGIVARPHFAQVMIEKGFVSSYNEAFSRYLGSSGAAYIPKVRMDPHRAIAAILESGGIPVLAHPIDLTADILLLEEYVKRLKEYGLQGLEVYYSTHTSRQIEACTSLADDYHLVKTGGTDFHGSRKPDIRLGYGFGNLHIPYRTVLDLHDRKNRLTDRKEI